VPTEHHLLYDASLQSNVLLVQVGSQEFADLLPTAKILHVCFVNERDTTFMDKPDGATTVVYVLCSDTFQMSCADGEPLLNDEIGSLTKLFLAKGTYGVIEWVALKRGIQPLLSIVNQMREMGVWTPELEELPRN